MEKLYTRKEAATILGVSLGTLDAAKAKGRISYVQYTENGSVFFTELGLQEYIAKFTHPATAKNAGSGFRKNRASAKRMV